MKYIIMNKTYNIQDDIKQNLHPDIVIFKHCNNYLLHF